MDSWTQGDLCPVFERVVRGLQNVPFGVNILDKSNAVGVFSGKITAVPALFGDHELVAYGDDILNWLARR